MAKATKSAVNQPESKVRTLVTYDGGQPAIVALMKTDPLFKKTSKYNDPTCLFEGSKDCVAQRAIYEITCKICTEPVVPMDSKGSNTGQTRLE